MTETAASTGRAEVQVRSIDVVDALGAPNLHQTFSDEPVPRSVLEQMVWAARRAQQGRSGVRNMIAVDDRELIEASREFVDGFEGSPAAYVVHCTDLDQARALGGVEYARSSTPLDAGAACAHLLLMAQVLGLGVCVTSGWSDAAIREWIGLPAHVRPDTVVAVGWARGEGTDATGANEPGPVHHNRFGSAFGQRT